MATWQCIKGCGACCYLDPLERPELSEYLAPEDLEAYFTLVGDDGWCKHFDQATRECRIYEKRPRFCRVEPDVFKDLYGVEPEELNDFAISCCQVQIEATYGDRSLELLRFEHAIGPEKTCN